MAGNVLCVILCTLSCPRRNNTDIPILLFTGLLFFFLELEKAFKHSSFSLREGCFYCLCFCLPFFMRHSKRIDYNHKNAFSVFVLFASKLLVRHNTSEFGPPGLFEFCLFMRPVKHFNVFFLILKEL